VEANCEFISAGGGHKVEEGTREGVHNDVDKEERRKVRRDVVYIPYYQVQYS